MTTNLLGYVALAYDEPKVWASGERNQALTKAHNRRVVAVAYDQLQQAFRILTLDSRGVLADWSYNELVIVLP